MGKKLFITGTGTDVGKTFVSGLIVKKLHDSGYSTGYYKAAMSGNIKDKNGLLIPGDAKFVKDISNISQPIESMCPYVYEIAVSPHLASRIEGNPVDIDLVKEGFSKLSNAYEYLVMEGSGGILCPIEWDSKKILLWELLKDLAIPAVIVADSKLGTINSVGLTVDFMKNKGIKVKGIIMNHYHEGDVMEEDNLKMCEELTGIKVISKIADNDSDINIEDEILTSCFEE